LSPAEAIESERRRIPLVVPRDDLLIDDDCPLCQMMAESEGPTFWHLDGCHMEEGFAFSFSKTPEEWEAERFEVEFPQEPSRTASRERADAGTATDASLVATGVGTMGERTLFFPDALDKLPADAVIPTMLFRIGAYLADLGLELKTAVESAEYVTSFNRDFANLRQAAADPESLMIGAVVGRFRENLASAAATRPDLVDKCADVENQLLQLQQRLGVL
jgi:hypothetical protein